MAVGATVPAAATGNTNYSSWSMIQDLRSWFPIIRLVHQNGTKIKHRISDDELATINISSCETLGKWNYVINPQI